MSDHNHTAMYYPKSHRSDNEWSPEELTRHAQGSDDKFVQVDGKLESVTGSLVKLTATLDKIDERTKRTETLMDQIVAGDRVPPKIRDHDKDIDRIFDKLEELVAKPSPCGICQTSQDLKVLQNKVNKRETWETWFIRLAVGGMVFFLGNSVWNLIIGA